jgi:hypothetical protein
MNPIDNPSLHLAVTYMAINTPWSYKENSLKNTRKTLKTQPCSQFKNISIKSSENNVEEEEESRRWRSVFVNQKLGCMLMLEHFYYDLLIACFQPLMDPSIYF